MSALKKYYRKPKIFISLPSNLHFYDDLSEEETSTFNEVGVMAMTTMNELTLKNPESLLNGEAIECLIKDCTTLKINPRKLIKADIDALLVGIKIATSGKTQDFDVKCPNEECGHESTHTRNLESILENIGKHEEDYKLTLDDGLVLHLRPSLFDEVMQLENHAFQEQKKANQIEQELKKILESGEDLDDESEIQFFSRMNQLFKEMTVATVDLYSKNITKIFIPDEEEVVDDHEEIKDWLEQIDTATFEKLKDEISRINSIGLDDTEKLTCPECGHEWTQQFDINMSDFFANGS